MQLAGKGGIFGKYLRAESVLYFDGEGGGVGVGGWGSKKCLFLL